MKHLKLIILCALASISAAYAAEKPQVIGFYLGMTRDKATNNIIAHNEQGTYLTVYPYVQLDPIQMLSNDLYMGTDGVSQLMDVRMLAIPECRPIASHDICQTLKRQKIQHIEPTQRFVIYDSRSLGIMMLGFVGDELVEMTVSPLMFNFMTHSTQSIANMLEKEWNIKFKFDKQFGDTWYLVDANNIIAVDNRNVIYIGKTIAMNTATPSMKMNNNHQYYKCMYCDYLKPNPNVVITPIKGKSKSNTTVQQTPAMNFGGGMMPVPSPYNNGYQPARPKQQMPCNGCNSSGKSSRYIEAPVYTTPIYSWCDTCKMEVKSHTHHACTICRGTGYITR